MCGGSGTRLWPWSRKSYPKQFLTLAGDRSLLQTTVERLKGLSLATEVLAFGNEEHRFLIAEQLRNTDAGVREIVLEPAGRNTAPVAIIAALRAQALWGEDSVVLLSPADHLIADAGAYRRVVEEAVPLAAAGKVVTFGIAPDRPETGYGYIEMGAPAGEGGARVIASFREKPDAQTAAGYVASGRFVWNSGVFVFAAGSLLRLAETLQPKMLEACRRACAGAVADLDFFRLDAGDFLGLEPVSFDVAFMEKLDRDGIVIPAEMGWSDIGSWDSIKKAYGANSEGSNIARGAAELFDCANVLALSDGPLVVAHGLKDALIVASQDAIYVAAAGLSEDIRHVVAALERRGRDEAVRHKKEFRPWGWYHTINGGDRFHVKEIVVSPGGRLSLQSHQHRAEHWVVVRGTATVTIGSETKLVTENQSVYIPVGARHRLENAGRIPVRLIEVQTGSYLEEDDIVRYDDQYGRQ
jgi:mannose-1-phosphate guanylyltransferase/mannose-6-phosphate isomerase